MRSTPYLLVILVFAAIQSSCRKDFDYAPANGKLEFSRDTVFLDTVFTNIGSATHLLKVYNRSSDDILIPSVRLDGGAGSSYRINVDGQAGDTFRDVPILARDSMYIFVETTFDIRPLQADTYLYTDAIVFDSGANEQKVPLVTLVKDAIFLYPGLTPEGSRETILLGRNKQGDAVEVPGFALRDNQLNFSSEKPYVIYGYAAASEGQEVHIDAGSRLHFHKDSGLFLGEGATLTVEGSLSQDAGQMEGEVVFEGDRLESGFADVPGQWGGVWLGMGSGNHKIEYLSIRNATVGLLAEGGAGGGQPGLSLKNTIIKNSSRVNLHCSGIAAVAQNLVLGNAADASLLCEGSGSYTFRHCTIANYWSQGARTGPSVQLAVSVSATLPQQARFINCLLAGNYARELGFYGDPGLFTVKFSHSMLRFEDNSGVFADDPLYDFNDPEKYDNTQLNASPGFFDAARQDFRIGPDSGGIGKADPAEAQFVPLDLAGADRRAAPDIGAYQAVNGNEIAKGSAKM